MFFVLRADYGNKPDYEEDEVFVASCDLTVKPSKSVAQRKGCIIRSNLISEEHDDSHQSVRVVGWKKYLCGQSCFQKLSDRLWMLSVRCASSAPQICNSTGLCSLLDGVRIFLYLICN